MTTPEKFKLLAARVRETFGSTPLSQAFQDRKAIIGPGNFPGTDEGKLAQEALDAMENNQDPDPRGLAALELMIKIMRPAALIQTGKLEPLDNQAATAFPDWGTFADAFRPMEFSVGRIDDVSGKGVGTGFLVNDQTVVTNAHVVSFLSRGTMLLTESQATINFRKEYKEFEQDVHKILAVIKVHEEHDLALLRIEPADQQGHPALAFADFDTSANAAIVAIGYPFDDPVRNPLFISGIYNGIFGFKRAAPGKVIAVSSGEVTHDCSTLGGNSGSPLLEMKTAKLAGVHIEGMFMYTNRAVPASILKTFCEAYAN
jgi:S1-C subfamily serine protease